MQLVGSLVAQLGGRLDVASGMGGTGGACFTVLFEASEAEHDGGDAVPELSGGFVVTDG
jgi:hypothetical protein